MRIKKVKAGITLLLAAVLLVLAGCPQEAEDPSGDAGLSSITINGVSVDAPEGIDRAAWVANDFQASAMDVAEALLPADLFDDDGEIKNASVTVSATGSDADIYFIKVSGGLEPDDSNWTKDASFTLKDKDSLYIQVTSADKRSQNYYRVRITRESAEAGLNALVIGGRSVGLKNIAGADSFADITPVETTFTFGVENTNASISVDKKEWLASVQYGVQKAGETAEPSWGGGDPFTFNEGDTLYVKVTPSDPAAGPKYYGVVLHTTLRITSVNIGGTVQAITADGPAAPGDVTAVNVSRVTQTVSNVLSVVTASDPVVVKYDLLTSDTTPNFKALTKDTSVTYTDGSILWLEVSAEGFIPQYHKFNIAVKSDDRSIVSIFIGTTQVTVIRGGDAAPDVTDTWGAWFPDWSTRGAVTVPATDASPGSVVTVNFTDSHARVTGFSIGSATATLTDDDYENITPASTTFNLPTPDGITNGQHLSIRVQAEDGSTWYHRIAVTVQP
jgi:hypothetical protein